MRGTYTPGIYRWASRRKVAPIIAEAESAGWRCIALSGQQIARKATFIAACADAMHFPSYAARNWDAFEECLTDLSWLKASGYVLLYDNPDPFAIAEPQEWATAQAILESAIAYWKQNQVPFFVLLRQASIRHCVVPLL